MTRLALVIILSIACPHPASADIGTAKCWFGRFWSRCWGRDGNPFTAKLREFIRVEMNDHKVPGTSIAIVDGSNMYAEGFGFSSLPDVRATPDTLYLAGSTTKAQTAACLSSMIHSGSHGDLSWSTKLSSVLGDDFAVRNAWATKHLTLNDAVSHRTGLPKHDRSLQRIRRGKPVSIRSLVRNMRHLPFIHEPRTKFIYGNYMYITLSLVIELLRGRPLSQVLRETIWEPLGMTSTYFGFDDVKASGARDRLATGYAWNHDQQRQVETVPMPLTDLSGAAAIISTVKDYARWIQALLDIDGARILSADVLRDIRKGRMLHLAENSGDFDVSIYTLGWFRRKYKNLLFFWHDGTMIGQRSLMYWFPRDKFGFVIFANGDDGEASNNNIAWKIIADKFKIAEKDVGVGHWPYTWSSAEKDFLEAAQRLYPDEPVTPFDGSVEEIQGVYWDKGYGTLRLVAVPPAVVTEHEKQQGSKAHEFLAKFPEKTWHYALRFRHVSGHKWIACESWLEDVDNPGQFHAVEFIPGSKRKAPELVISWWAFDWFEGSVTYTKTT